MVATRKVSAAHAVAAVVFGLLFWTGVDGLNSGAHALAVPMLITGAGGAIGALVIVWSVLRRPQVGSGAARTGMVVAAVATVVVGLALAPGGSERGFVIAVNCIIAALLAAFAFFAGARTTAAG